MKTLVCLFALASATAAFADGSPTSTVIQARTLIGEPDNYSDACYSFYYGTHDEKITHKFYDIELKDSTLYTNQDVRDFGAIVDLGKMSCKDVQANDLQPGEYPGKDHKGRAYKEDRVQNPWLWFQSSVAMEKLNGQEPLSSAVKAKKGHCYVIHKVSSKRRVIAFFHVKKLEAGKYVTLDEIEVFKRQEMSDKAVDDQQNQDDDASDDDKQQSDAKAKSQPKDIKVDLVDQDDNN